MKPRFQMHVWNPDQCFLVYLTQNLLICLQTKAIIIIPHNKENSNNHFLQQ